MRWRKECLPSLADNASGIHFEPMLPDNKWPIADEKCDNCGLCFVSMMVAGKFSRRIFCTVRRLKWPSMNINLQGRPASQPTFRSILFWHKTLRFALTCWKMFLKCSHLITEVMRHDRDIRTGMAPRLSDMVAYRKIAFLSQGRWDRVQVQSLA